jgi:hypothetical protein
MSYNNYTGWGFVPQKVDKREFTGKDIITFGRKNTYPQEIQYAIERSNIASSAVKLYSSFLFGNGFIEGGDEVVNDKGETLNDILKQVCISRTMFAGFGLLLNINSLGQYASIESEKFSYIRLGIPEDRSNNFTCAYVSDNWANESWRNNASIYDAVKRDLFDPSTIEQVLQDQELDEYNGQLLYHTTNKGFYPNSPFDPVIEQILTNGELAQFDRAFVLNGFAASLIFKNNTQSVNDETYEANREEIDKMAGAQSAGGVYYLEGDIETVDTSKGNKISDQYQVLKTGLKEDVYELLNIPPVLSGRTRQGGFPNQEELRDAFAFFNGYLEEERQEICRVFNRINEVFERPLVSGGFEIETKSFDIESVEENDGNPSI